MLNSSIDFYKICNSFSKATIYFWYSGWGIFIECAIFVLGLIILAGIGLGIFLLVKFLK